MEAFEAEPSRADTGTGTRREGKQFERLARQFWDAVASWAACGVLGSKCTIKVDSRRWTGLLSGKRALYLPQSTEGQACGLDVAVGRHVKRRLGQVQKQVPCQLPSPGR